MVNRRRFLQVLAVSLTIFAASFVFRHGVYPLFVVKDTTIHEIDKEPQLFNNVRVRLRGYVVYACYMSGTQYVLTDYGRGAVPVSHCVVESGEGQEYVPKYSSGVTIVLRGRIDLEPYVISVWGCEENETEGCRRTNKLITVVGIVHYTGLAKYAPAFHLEVERLEF